ncbi:unnamed protein product [Spirodela intermedia]|uniref:BTB domain-containing protein n=1 Tax=Spirodela intermedia TaxID=51605 RepID=A0A7I8JE96_SPIIN|nr:unnamed protein product [Spirodela intermedia]CAA6668437.1 unnamed protein product [Spirodela intermedia]
MWCHSCREEYEDVDAGTCKECYEEASETEEELKREIEDLKAKVSFLRLCSPIDPHLPPPHPPPPPIFPFTPGPVAVTAHPDYCLNQPGASPDEPFACLQGHAGERDGGEPERHHQDRDVSYTVLQTFIHYLYTAEALLDEQMACDLLVLAERYQVKHLKVFCEKFMISKVNGETAVMSFAFAHRHNAGMLLETALALILDNMSMLTAREEYRELVEKDPRLVVEIYEAYLTRQVNTAPRE